MAQGSFELVEQGGGVRDGDGRAVVSQASGTTVAVPSGTATDTVVKASPGVLLKVLVTATNTNAVSIFDNATGHTGTVVGYVPANAATGSFYAFGLPAANGITVQGNAANPALTISFI